MEMFEWGSLLFDFYSPGDLEILVRQVRAQLKKIAITDRTRVDEMFLRYNKDRSGFIDADNMRNLCRSLQLPVDDDVIAAVSSLFIFFFKWIHVNNLP
jgi:Ca2+-binding EF-hand superfamily protein